MHDRLQPYLELYNVSYAAFTKKGRPISNIVSIRSAVISDLHSQGVSWAEMQAITGLSNGTIQRLTTQKRCDAVIRQAQQRMTAVSKSRAGIKKPKLSDFLREKWKAGGFACHLGHRSESHRQKMKDAFTTERRLLISERMKRHWGDETYRSNLLAFHRSAEQRHIRSFNMTLFLQKHPSQMRGKGSYVDVTKCQNGNRIWVRSKQEVKAVSMLESDDNVLSYMYEYRFENAQRYYLPDFIVYYKDKTVMIEVKPRWVVDAGLQKEKLSVYEQHAYAMGWGFEIWSLS